MEKRTVQLLLIDGDANGRIQAKLDNWTGVAYKIPKILLAESRDREDLKFCGVYFLFGRAEDTGEPVVYIGQARERKNGESLLVRFAEHNRSEKKNFCNEIVFFTTSTNDFGATELCYLENQFWNLAHVAGRYKLVNGCEPAKGNVTEAKQAELDRFISNARILMTTFGHRVFEDKVLRATQTPEQPEPKSVLLKFERSVKGVGKVTAQCEWTSEGFVLLKGSHVLMRNKPGLLPSVLSLRNHLYAEGKLSPLSGVYHLLQDELIFPSSSTAAEFVLGGSCNGRTSWFAEINGEKRYLCDLLDEEEHSTITDPKPIANSCMECGRVCESNYSPDFEYTPVADSEDLTTSD